MSKDDKLCLGSVWDAWLDKNGFCKLDGTEDHGFCKSDGTEDHAFNVVVDLGGFWYKIVKLMWWVVIV